MIPVEMIETRDPINSKQKKKKQQQTQQEYETVTITLAISQQQILTAVHCIGFVLLIFYISVFGLRL